MAKAAYRVRVRFMASVRFRDRVMLGLVGLELGLGTAKWL